MNPCLFENEQQYILIPESKENDCIFVEKFMCKSKDCLIFWTRHLLTQPGITNAHLCAFMDAVLRNIGEEMERKNPLQP